MLRLQPFTEQDFAILLRWVNSKELLYQFAGPQFNYPLTMSQLTSYINDPTKKVVKMYDEKRGVMIGHGEFNYKHPELPRLSRIIIDPNETGKGYGNKLIMLMVEELKIDSRTEQIDLCVFSWNESAIRCYEKVGFKIVEENTTTFINGDLTWDRLNMVLKLK